MNYRNHVNTEAKTIHHSLLSLKESVDSMVNQLTKGHYLTTSTFANNLLHFSRSFEPIQKLLSNSDVLEMLLREDVMLAADLIATCRTIAMMNNFLNCILAPER